uniref:Protein kinase domain-containing protein n=1 Tax=Clytia hemisphaerica TaxID=252671 RepID=A0A7M6DQA5_9CNID
MLNFTLVMKILTINFSEEIEIMSKNVLKTEKGAAFFIDLEQIINKETKVEKEKYEKKKHSGGTSIYIPLFDKDGCEASDSPEKNKQPNSIEDSSSTRGKLTAVDEKESDLSATFTKEDFQKLRNQQKDSTLVIEKDHANVQKCNSKNVSTGATKGLNSPRPFSATKIESASTKPALLLRNRQNLKLEKSYSSPDLISAASKFPHFNKSHQELKELIIEYDKKEKEQTPHAVWSSTYARLPKLPSFDQCQIEEMFADQKTNNLTHMQNIEPKSLPPIHKIPTVSKCNDKFATKQKVKTKTSNKQSTVNKPTRTKNPNKKKVSASKKPYNNLKQPKQNKNKGKKKHIDPPEPADKVTDDVNQEPDISDNNIEMLLKDVDSIINEQNKESNNQAGTSSNISHSDFSMEDSIEVFYDNVLKAEPPPTTDLQFPALAELRHTKENVGLFNTFNQITNAKFTDSLVEDELAQSMDHTLSIDESNESFPAPNRIARLRPDLSHISEEKSIFLTQATNSTKRKYNSTNGADGESVFYTESTINNDSDSQFQEITNIAFQPGLMTNSSGSGLNSLESISINQSTVCSSSDGTLTDRPYVRSVLGRTPTTARSLYSSSSNGSDDVDNVLEWQKGKVIDRGAFGIVYQGLTNTGQMIAVKEVDINHSKNAAKNFRKLQDEINILKSLRHPNVIKFIGTSLDDNIVHIFMEYIAGGSLAGLISNFGALNESIYQRYTQQIMSGVHYLHKFGVIHRDIKGANILITVKGNIKLIDFGCAKELSISVGSTVLLKSVKGTPYWMSPETVRGTGCNHKSDIWSVGCTVMEMATGKPPW